MSRKTTYREGERLRRENKELRNALHAIAKNSNTQQLVHFKCSESASLLLRKMRDSGHVMIADLSYADNETLTISALNKPKYPWET